VRVSGHYYQELARSISAIKKELPNIIFVGAIPAQYSGEIEYNPLTNKKFMLWTKHGKWRLDRQKWQIEREGKPLSKDDFQNGLMEFTLWRTEK